MGDILAFLVVAAAFGSVLAGLTWLATRVRARGVGGEIMATVDQLYRPNAHQSHIEVQAQQDRRAPTSAPGDLPHLDRP